MKKLLLIILSFLCCSLSVASPIKKMIFFGDSLSDNGNLYQLLKIVPVSPPYYQGRFSNGPTWAEHVADYFYHKSYIASTNYCYGGATAILHNPIHDSFVAPMLLEEEIDGYLLHSPFADKSKTLYTIWIGANDYLYDRQKNIDKLTTDVVNKISWAITTLIKQGGKTFLVLNLPDLAKPPYARENNVVERLGAISQMHNQKIAQLVADLQKQYPDVKFITFDIYSLLNDVLAHIDQYNQQYHSHVTNTTDSCWTGGWITDKSKDDITTDLQKAFTDNNLPLPKNANAERLRRMILQSPALATAYQLGKHHAELEPCANADEYVFWDVLHPTAVIHKTLGQIMINFLEAEQVG